MLREAVAESVHPDISTAIENPLERPVEEVSGELLGTEPVVVGRFADSSVTAVAEPVRTAPESARTATESTEEEHENLIDEIIQSFPSYTRERAGRLLMDNNWDFLAAASAAMRPARDRIAQRRAAGTAGGVVGESVEEVYASAATPVGTVTEPESAPAPAEAMLAS